MKLDDFLLTEDLTEAAFAERIGSSQPHVNRLRRGKCFPSREMVKKIHAATGEKVTVDDWYADDLQKAG